MKRAYIGLHDCIYGGDTAVKSRPVICRVGYLAINPLSALFLISLKRPEMARTALLTMNNVFIPKTKLKRVGAKYERITGVYYER